MTPPRAGRPAAGARSVAFRRGGRVEHLVRWPATGVGSRKNWLIVLRRSDSRSFTSWSARRSTRGWSARWRRAATLPLRPSVSSPPPGSGKGATNVSAVRGRISGGAAAPRRADRVGRKAASSMSSTTARRRRVSATRQQSIAPYSGNSGWPSASTPPQALSGALDVVEEVLGRDRFRTASAAAHRRVPPTWTRVCRGRAAPRIRRTRGRPRWQPRESPGQRTTPGHSVPDGRTNDRSPAAGLPLFGASRAPRAR